MSESSDRGFNEYEYDGTWGVTYFDYRPEVLEWFESRGLQGGGYTWEALVQAAFELEPSPLSQGIEYDSEGDAFNAYTRTEESRDLLKSKITTIVEDLDFRQRCIEQAEKGGYIE